MGAKPNVLSIFTDQQCYPPPYDSYELADYGASILLGWSAFGRPASHSTITSQRPPSAPQVELLSSWPVSVAERG